MSLKSRVLRLEQRTRPGDRPRPFRFVLIEGKDGPPAVEGRCMLNLNVPRSSGGDPEAALTPEQKALIRPGDKVVVVFKSAAGEGDPADQSGDE